jgi:Siphovirus-type tail component, C-terminal domain
VTVLATPAIDTGFWTGAIDYTPASGNGTILSGVSIPLGEVDGNGIAWLINRLEGWDSPDVQGGGVIPKSGDHGAWAAPQYYAARQLTLTLSASAPTQALRDQARALLQQAVPVSDLALFTYNEPVPKQMMVRRSGRITETYPTLADVTFVVGLVAPDPRKYGTQALSTGPVNVSPAGMGGFTVPFTVPFSLPAQPPSGSAAVTNPGTFETRPVIMINGPITNPALINVTTGQTVSWTGLVLGPADVLTVDFKLRQAFLNGAYRSADLGSAWWTLPAGTPGTPGTSTIQLGGTPGSGASFQVNWRPSWI